MKYYGCIYEGQVANYQIEDTQAFDSPYDALNYANQQWQKIPNVQIPRLLVVKKDDCVENIDFGAFNRWTYSQKIYCRASSKPSGWSTLWKSDCSASVTWNYTGA